MSQLVLFNDNSFLSYLLVSKLAKIGIQSNNLEEKIILFDAAATFYCRAVSHGGQNIAESSKIPGASNDFNYVELWLTKWRHNVLMHEFCVSRGFLLTPTSDDTDIIVRKYTIESETSVNERLQVALDLSLYHIQNQLQPLNNFFAVKVDAYRKVDSDLSYHVLSFPVLTELSLKVSDGSDLEVAKKTFRDLLSHLLIHDMLSQAIDNIDKYIAIYDTPDWNPLWLFWWFPPMKLNQKAVKIALLIKSVNLIYATHSSGHLTQNNVISELVGDVRAGGGHGGTVAKYFEWQDFPVSECGDDIRVAMDKTIETIILPTNDVVNQILLEAKALKVVASEECKKLKQALLGCIKLNESKKVDFKIPNGLSRIILNGPKARPREEDLPQADLFDLDTEFPSLFGETEE